MKNAKEFMNDFMITLDNMKKYQGIDITDPKTYMNESGIVHEAFILEKKVVSTVEATEIQEDNNKIDETTNQLRLIRKK